MESKDLLIDAFGRVQEEVHGLLENLSPDQLTYRVEPAANTIAWLVWHLTRVEDNHIAEAAGAKELWHEAGWAERFGLPFDADATGYGQSSDEVGAVRASAQLLRDYYDAVHARTASYLSTLAGADLDRVVDERWEPPVTLGVRLISVIADELQHVGQAAFIRGAVERR